MLREESDHGQVVAEHARAFLGRLDSRGNGAERMIAFGDRGEQIQIDRAAQRHRALIGLQRVKNDARRRSLGLCGGRHTTIISPMYPHAAENAARQSLVAENLLVTFVEQIIHLEDRREVLGDVVRCAGVNVLVARDCV